MREICISAFTKEIKREKLLGTELVEIPKNDKNDNQQVAYIMNM